MQPRYSSLRGKFLWLTVPVFLVSAALLLVFLAQQRATELQQLRLAEARQQLERDAGLLSMPMWNLDHPSVRNLGQSAVDSNRAVCVRIGDMIGRPEPFNFGDCADLEALSLIEASVLAPGTGEPIGRLEYWVDTKIARSQLLSDLRPLLMMLAMLVLALVACVMIAFRRIIIKPLALAQHSIRAYHQDGRYLEVPYDSADELGDFIREFNAGLQRQQSAEHDLQARLDFQSALNRTLPLPVAVVDNAGSLIENNAAFDRAFLDELPPSPAQLEAIVPELDLNRLRALQIGAIQQQEIGYRDRNGVPHTYQVEASVLVKPDGDSRGWLLVFQNVTNRIESARALAAAFEEAQRTLDELQHAQASLIQAEKLASLGAVVAGIAHEVNTPVGSSLTVATALAGKLQAFRTHLASDSLRRSMLVEFVDEVTEASEILRRGLTRAADQIAKFKQVAADQTSSQRRSFDLATVVDEVLSVLRPSLRGRQIELQVEVPDHFTMDSYPGPLGQVITNLVANAVQHGFEGKRPGRIRIHATTVDPDRVLLQLSDDGVGIEEEHMGRIFDPFFTTKMGRGGTGLGLNLVYTMVGNVLGGTVKVESERGRGTRFIIDLPCVAPLAADREGEHRSNA